MEPLIGFRLGYRRAEADEAHCLECAKCAQRPGTKEFYCHQPVKGLAVPWATSEAWNASTASYQRVAPYKRCDLFEKGA